MLRGVRVNRWRLTAHCPTCGATVSHGKHGRDGKPYGDADMLLWTRLGVVGMRCEKHGDVDAQTRANLLAGEWWPDHMRPIARGIAHNDNNDERTGT